MFTFKLHSTELLSFCFLENFKTLKFQFLYYIRHLTVILGNIGTKIDLSLQLSYEKFQEFCKIVVNDNISNKQKFMELHTICAGKMELQEMLLDLLTDAGEAHEISNDVYAQYCLRDAVKTFFRKVKISFQVSNPLVYR